MKNTLGIVFFALLCGHSGFAQTPNYKAGDTLRVFTLGGLKLREQSNLSAKAIATMPFGEAVVVAQVSPAGKTGVLRVEGFSGQWVKVRYGGQTGFAFDGFLSALPIPEPRSDTRVLTPEEKMEHEQYRGHELEAAFSDYIGKHFTRICTPVEYYNGAMGEGSELLTIQKLSRDFTEIKIGGWEGYGTELVMPNTRLSEIKNLLLALANTCGLPNTVVEKLKTSLEKLDEEGIVYQDLELKMEAFWLIIKRYPMKNDSPKWSVKMSCAVS